MAEAANLEVGVSANLASLYTGLAQAADRIGQFGDKVNKQLDAVGRSFDRLNGYLKLLGVGIGAAEFVGGIKSAIDYADKLNDLSKSTGIAVETLGGLGYAAKQSGVDLETVAKGVQKLAQNMAEAAGGNTQLTDLFQRMGVSIKDATGALRPLDQVLGDVATKFQSYKDGPEKAALATDLFKKGGEALIPLLNEGGQKLAELVAEYERYGGVTAEVAARSDKFNDTLEQVKLIGGALFRDIASALLPTLQAMANVFLDAKVRGDGFSETARSITVAVKAMGVAAVTVVGAFEGLGKALGTTLATLVDVINPKKGGLQGILDIWNNLKAGLSDAWKSVSDAGTRAAAIWNADSETIASSSERNLGGKTTAPIKKVVQSIKDLTSSLDAYLKSLTDIELSYASALAKSQSQAFGVTEAALKRQYDQGVIDFRTYYQKLTDVQRQAIGAQIQEARTQVVAQQTLVAQLQASFDSLKYDPGKYKNFAQFQSDQLKAQTALNEANAKLITLQGTLNDKIAESTQIGSDYVEAFLVPASNGTLQFISDLDKQIDALQRQNEEIGLTQAQVAALNVQRVEEARINAILSGQGPEIIAFYDRQLERLGRIADLAAQGEFKQKWVEGWRDLFQSAADRGAQFLDDFRQHGTSAFRNLWEDFKRWAFEALAKIAAQQIILRITAGTSLAGIAQNTFGQSLNPLQLLSGAAGGGTEGGGGILSGLNNLPGLIGLPSFSTAVENLGTILPTFSASLESGAGILSSASAAFAGTLSSFATVALPLIPLALPLISGLFDHKPSPAKGQFGFSPGTTGFEDNAFVSTVIGKLNAGFLDANTQQFSGDAAKVFDQIITGALDAFSSRYSPEQSDRLAQILQKTTFPTFEGTFSTEDFIKQYGGQVLQQVIAQAFNVLDPALGSVAAAFSGTADETAKFGNTLLGIYDASKNFGDAFRQNVIAALSDATQATADKVLAFVQVVQQFGDVIAGLGPKLEALDPASITAFVDALGGAQQLASTLQFIGANFSTSADRISQAQRTLNADFANLGLTVPQTHAAFLALLNSFDLTTESGRTLYAQVAALAPLFVQVAGTADQAAQALQQQISSASDFFNQNFYTDAERQAKQLASDTQAIADAQERLGVAIPTSIDGFRNLIEGIDQSTDAGKALYNALIVLAPAVHDLGTAAQTAAQQVSDAVNSISHPVDVQQYLDGVTNNIAAIANLAQQSTGDFGAKLSLQVQLLGSAIQKTQDAITKATAAGDYSRIAYLLTPQLKAYQQAQTQVANELARFITLSAQYDAARAEQLVGLEDWYAAQKKLFAGQADVLAALKTIYDDKWKAIVDGVSSGVDGALDQLARLRQGIADYLKGLAIGDLSPLTPLQQLQQAQQAYVDELLKAQSGDQTALGDITRFADAYLKEARDFFASSQNYTDIFSAVTGQLGDLAGTSSTGLPLPTSAATTDVNAALAAVLPTDSKLASSNDIKTLTEQTREMFTALAAAGTQDTQTIVNAITTGSTMTAEASGFNLR